MPRQYHEADSKKAARRLYELPLHEQIPPNVRTLTDSTLSVERHAPRRNVGDDAHIVPLRGGSPPHPDEWYVTVGAATSRPKPDGFNTPG